MEREIVVGLIENHGWMTSMLPEIARACGMEWPEIHELLDRGYNRAEAELEAIRKEKEG